MAYVLRVFNTSNSLYDFVGLICGVLGSCKLLCLRARGVLRQQPWVVSFGIDTWRVLF